METIRWEMLWSVRTYPWRTRLADNANMAPWLRWASEYNAND